MKNLLFSILSSVLTIVSIQAQWSGSTTIENDIYRNGSIGLGISTPAYKVDALNIAANTSIQLLSEGTANTSGSSFLRLWAGGRSIFDVAYFTQGSGFKTHLSINYAINGSNGYQKYVYVGTKYAPIIELDADNGAILLYGENGTGANLRTPTHNLGLCVAKSGNIGIGTTNPGAKLDVNGNIRAERVDIIADVPASDFVFQPDYKLRSLQEVENFVKENKHLPEVPSAAEFKENGYSVGQMDDILLRKVEELTLYIIEQQKLIEQLQQKVEQLENK